MSGHDDRAGQAAKQAYWHAVGGGAGIHVAFGLACEAYRAWHDIEGPTLHEAVGRWAAVSREDMIRIEVGLYSA